MMLTTPIDTVAGQVPARRFIRRAPRGSVMVASDCSAQSDAAVRVAADLARFGGTPIEILSVQPREFLPLPTIEPGLIPASVPPDDPTALERRERLRFAVREQILAVCGEARTWPVDVVTGSPAVVIVGEAWRRNPALILMGLREHGTFDRLLGEDTTLRVVRRSPVPVLAVTAALAGLPRRVIVGVDFSRASLHAARAALDLMPPDGTLILVHVQPGDEHPPESLEGRGIVYAQGVVGSFARFRAELERPKETTIVTVLLEGDASHELLAFADRAGAELVAVGSHHHSLYERVVQGTITAALIRAARYSVLVRPADPPIPPG